MRLPGMAVGFAPWVLYLVLPHQATMTFAAVVAFVAACATSQWTRGRSGLKLLDAAAVPTFAVLAALSAVGPAAEWLRLYSSGTVLFVLAAVMLGSLLSTPFTEQYAHEALPAAYWRSPHLHWLNVRISGAWAACMFAAAVSVTVSQLVSDPRPSTLNQYLTLSLTWLLPVLLMSAVTRYTSIVTGIASSRPHRNGVLS